MNFNAFLRDELWFSNGSAMNDDFEARLYYDRIKIQEWVDSFVVENGWLKVLGELKVMDSVPVELNQIIPNAEYIMNIIKNLPNNQLELISKQVMQIIGDNLDISLKENIDIVQSSIKFASLSEKIYSDMMWGHYAKDATGFAVEYEFGKNNVLKYQGGINGQSKITCSLYPLLYEDKRMDATAYAIYLYKFRLLKHIANACGLPLTNQMLNAIVPCPDEFMCTKLGLIKSDEWKPEGEWRMFYTSFDMSLVNELHSCVVQKPSAIYFGRKISQINQKILVDIAREKGLPVYKLDFDDSRSFKLKSYRVE